MGRARDPDTSRRNPQVDTVAVNHRRCYLETLLYGNPERIPLTPGEPRESTLRRWHAEGLPEGMHHLDAAAERLGIDLQRPATPPVDLGVDFRMIPWFEEKVLEHKDGHYLVQDWMGAITEISDEYDYTYIRSAKDFVTRKWHRFPVQTREDWHEMRRRYDPDTPQRLPADFAERCARLRKRDDFAGVNFNGPYWQLREWLGFENLSVLFLTQPDWVEEMIEFWSGFVSRMLERILSRVQLDYIWFSEDMAFKAHPMIGPDMARRFLLPTWRRWADLARRYGVQIVDVDSDGYIEDLIPVWIEAGVNCCDPIEVAAHNDILRFRERFGTAMAYKGGIDKRAIAAGGRAILAEIKRNEPVIRGGGFIPGCDHGVPPDISWDNFVEYTRLLAQVTGWL